MELEIDLFLELMVQMAYTSFIVIMIDNGAIYRSFGRISALVLGGILMDIAKVAPHSVKRDPFIKDKHFTFDMSRLA
ncbi:hypothetical protein JOC54_003195 [Alkalihalobacillus xiaoxiensis]|uniref:Uncharacterized protein n=1 Tax=Shouchella xiaoxiensis TaxID=766895 RepID=A0ABS2SXF8_9BACI|nr:hypothetical protein [Shouchella xiaoxiensis]MBM7839915.1 hypothetical protein [Shouchella xiaoxiensis]